MNYLNLFKTYLLLEKNMSENTVNSYTHDLEQFYEFIGDKKITEVQPVDISNFIVYIRTKNNSVRTSNRKLSALKTFFSFMVRRNIIQYNPASSIESGKIPKRIPKPLTTYEINNIITTISNPRDKLILEILYGTGIRREELIKLKVDDINLFSGELRVIGKGDKERIVPLTDSLINLLKQYLKTHNNHWLFPGKNSNTHISKRRINEIVSRWGSGITPHRFRHSFATHMFENGADLKVIQDILGHENANTTQIYTKLSSNRNRLAVKQFHPHS